MQHGTNHIRLLGFEDNGTFVVLTNAFRKKDQKVPKKEIVLAQERKREYLSHE
ncbi:MAG: type II toxin-antitoxin system RelE/ParE family toxin [Campylobacterota bacterium]